MKTISYSQKKWALTGCLLVALGFNLSMHKHTEGVASAEFASTSDDVAETGLDTANGHVEVKYVKLSEKQTMAVITEGTICATCGNTITLNAAFNNNAKGISSLNVALLKFVSDDADAPPKKHIKVADDDEDTDSKSSSDDDVDATEVTKQLVKAVKQKCDKENDDTSGKMTCYGDSLGTLMSPSKKGAPKVELDQEVLQNFYAKQIEPLLNKQLVAAHNALLTRAEGGNNMFQSDADQDPDQMRQDALDVIGHLIAKTPDKFDGLRKNIINQEKEIITATAVDVQRTYIQADKMKDPVKHNEADFKRQDLNVLSTGIDKANRYGFDSATNYDRIDSDDATNYYNLIDSYSKLLLGNLISNPTTYQIPGAPAPDALAAQNGGARVGNDFSRGTPTPGAAQQPAATNPNAGSITFGAVQAITPDMALQRQRERSQFNFK